MRKILIIGLVAVFALFLTYGTSNAVTGRCDNCHTMHNSQNGTHMILLGVGESDTTPKDTLLRGTCLGCHSDTTSNTTKALGTSTAPIVFNTGGATTDPGTSQSWSGATYNLAGGNFYYTYGASAAIDAKGHDVDMVDAANTDTTLGNTPPGWNAADDESSVDYDDTDRLTCAGSNGCHGDRDLTGSYAGIKGAHHTNAGGNLNTATTIGNSFRFLKGVKGYEDTDWQQSASTSDHNEYFGATSQGTLASTYTISALCRQCHGLFHSALGGPSPWTRHPTDEDVMGKGGEYAAYNTDNTTGTYSLHAPVGDVGTLAGARSTVTATDSPVICLSCHRAHGSPNDDILRWDYAGMVAGSGTSDTGCFTCHTTKNAD